jgi:NADH:ubiquinone oxidoreductase subunit H
MAMGWKIMLPLSLLNLMATGGALLAIKGPLTS